MLLSKTTSKDALTLGLVWWSRLLKNALTYLMIDNNFINTFDIRFTSIFHCFNYGIFYLLFYYNCICTLFWTKHEGDGLLWQADVLKINFYEIKTNYKVHFAFRIHSRPKSAFTFLFNCMKFTLNKLSLHRRLDKNFALIMRKDKWKWKWNTDFYASNPQRYAVNVKITSYMFSCFEFSIFTFNWNILWSEFIFIIRFESLIQRLVVV